jgi:hypothetical protein
LLIFKFSNHQIKKIFPRVCSSLILGQTVVMSLLNQQKGKDKKKGDKKKPSAGAQGSKFIQKPASGFVSKQANTGSQRGS